MLLPGRLMPRLHLGRKYMNTIMISSEATLAGPAVATPLVSRVPIVPLCTVLLLVITQIGLAVGDTEQERQKAEFTKLKAWVGNIVNILNMKLLHTVMSIVFMSSMDLPKKFDNYMKSL